jgi:hypothetical protein
MVRGTLHASVAVRPVVQKLNRNRGQQQQLEASLEAMIESGEISQAEVDRFMEDEGLKHAAAPPSRASEWEVLAPEAPVAASKHSAWEAFLPEEPIAAGVETAEEDERYLLDSDRLGEMRREAKRSRREDRQRGGQENGPKRVKRSTEATPRAVKPSITSPKSIPGPTDAPRREAAPSVVEPETVAPVKSKAPSMWDEFL